MIHETNRFFDYYIFSSNLLHHRLVLYFQNWLLIFWSNRV